MTLPLRIRSKSLLLTYPHCPVAKSELLDAVWKSCSDWTPVYAVCAEEKHADGQPHLHCFIMCEAPCKIVKKDMKMFDIIKHDICYHCNIKSCKSPKDAIRYVKKDGNYITNGTCPYKDCYTTLEKNKLLESKKLSELVECGELSIFKVPQLQKAISILQNERMENRGRDEPPQTYWFWGDTGAGKTKEAVSFATEKGLSFWISNSNDKWFDGYSGQEVAILDDIRASSWDFTNLLRLTDRYCYQVPVKGSFRPWRPKYIFITAPGRPEEVYSNHSTGETFDGIEQLLRRITAIVEFPIKEKFVPPNPELGAITEQSEGGDGADEQPVEGFVQHETNQWDPIGK